MENGMEKDMEKLNGHWDHVLIYGDVGFPKLETTFFGRVSHNKF